MNDESMIAQGTASNRAAAEALQNIVGQNHYAGGNALLSAEAEAGAMDNAELDRLSETEIASNQATEDSIEAKKFTTDGNSPIKFEHLSNEGDLSLTNDVPMAEK